MNFQEEVLNTRVKKPPPYLSPHSFRRCEGSLIYFYLLSAQNRSNFLDGKSSHFSRHRMNYYYRASIYIDLREYRKYLQRVTPLKRERFIIKIHSSMRSVREPCAWPVNVCSWVLEANLFCIRVYTIVVIVSYSSCERVSQSVAFTRFSRASHRPVSVKIPSAPSTGKH